MRTPVQESHPVCESEGQKGPPLMARKSKEFGELLRPQKSSQRQEKFLERFKSNLERGPLGGEKIVISPPGEAKMSDVLTDFVAPYRTEVDTEIAYQRLLELAIMAWNTALLPAPEQPEMIDRIIAEGFPKAHQELKQGMKDILDQFLARKNQYFSENKRLIIDFELKDTGRDYHLSVASTLSEIS